MTELLEPSVETPVPAPREKSIYRALLTAIMLYLAYTVPLVLYNYYVDRHNLAVPPILLVLVVVLSTLGYLAIILLMIRALAQPMLSVRQEIFLGIASLLIFLGINPLVWQAIGAFWQGKNLWEVFASLTASAPNLLLDHALPLFLILTGVFAGRLLARLIGEKALLVPVGIIAALIDFWGVYWGFVGQWTKVLPNVVSGLGSATTVAARIPEATAQHLHGVVAVLSKITPPGTIGIGDFVFLTFFLACAIRLGFSVKRTMIGLFTGLLLAAAIMAFDGTTLFGHEMTITYLPGLVFICAGVLLANIRSWKLSRQEWAMTGLLIAFLSIFITISIIKAEQGKPFIRNRYYTLPLQPDQEVLKVAESRLHQDARKGEEVLVCDARMFYQQAPSGLRLVQWQLLALGRLKTSTETNTREYLVMGILPANRTEWRIKQVTAMPPEHVLQALLSQRSTDPRQVIRQAKPLPGAAFDLMQQMPLYSAEAKGKKGLFLWLHQSEGEILDAEGRQVTMLPYLTPAKKGPE